MIRPKHFGHRDVLEFYFVDLAKSAARLSRLNEKLREHGKAEMPEPPEGG